MSDLDRVKEKVTPFSDADVAKVRVNEALLVHASPLTLACMVLSGISRIEADRTTIADLLSALRKAEGHIDRVSGGGETDLRAELNAAIAKAEGGNQ